MPAVSLAHLAMATRFEIVLQGENPVSLRAAGEEAFREIDRLEAQLSLYRPSSEISYLNARAAHGPVRVAPNLFALLEHAKRLSEETGGAFDITIAPLIHCWGFMGGGGTFPDADKLAGAKANIGMHLVHLNARDFTVQFEREGVMLDLGAIGKGYAIEQAADILREAGVTSAVIHGGTSTVCAIGKPSDSESWKIGIENPRNRRDILAVQPEAKPAAVEKSLLATIPLKDEALSVSAVWGKYFQADGKTFGHVLDPRTGYPVEHSLLAAVALPGATETDALSTALLVSGAAGHQKIFELRTGMKTLLVTESTNGIQAEAKGILLQPQPSA
jgi:thiamine biosynthesis lipoprotein